MILIFLIINLKQAKIKQEIIDYQIGQFILTKDEQFNLEAIEIIPNQFLDIIEIEGQNMLLFQSSYQFDQIIDLQKNIPYYESIDQEIWILGVKENFYFLAQLSTDQTDNNIMNQIFEILPAAFQCFSFNFLLDGQVIFDCTDYKNDFYLIYDTKSPRQYKVFYQQQFSSIRKLNFIKGMNIIVIQNNNQLFFIQYKQKTKRYYVFYRHKLINNYLYIQIDIQSYTVILKFKHSLQKFWFQNFDQDYEFINHEIQNLSNIDIEYNFYFEYDQYLFYVKNFSLYSNQSDKSILQLEGQVYNIVNDENVMVLQTNNFINIINFKKEDTKIEQINHTFYNDKVLINRKKQKIYVLNSTNLLVYFYGIRISNTIRVNQPVLFQRQKKSNSILLIFQINNSYIMENQEFQFRPNKNYQDYKNLDFIFSGGSINISFEQVDYLDINISYLKLSSEFTCNKLYLMKNDYNLKSYKSLLCYQNQFFQEIQCIFKCLLQSEIINLNQNSEQFLSNDSGFYYILKENSKTQLIFSDRQKKIKLIYDLSENATLIAFDTNKVFQINHQQKQMEVITFFDQIKPQYIKIYPRMIRFDETHNQMILIENQIATLFVQELDHYHKIQTFELCDDFMDFIVLNIYLVQICKTKIFKYTQITNYVYQFSGFIDIYGETFNTNSHVLNSQKAHFYIIYENQISIFNIKLPLKQVYVKKLDVEQFDQVIAILDNLCIRRQNQVQCYQINSQLIFKYDEDKFEYNEKIQLKICAENYYDKKCTKKEFHIQQTYNKIKVHEQRVKIYLDPNYRKIKLNNKFFSGSVHKVEADKFQFEQQILTNQFDLVQVSQANQKLICSYFQNYVTFDFQSEIILYDIAQNQSASIKAVQSKDLVKINNYIIFLGSKYLTEIFDCTDLKNCFKVCNFERTFNIFDLLDVQNDTITIYLNQQIEVYKFELCQFKFIITFKIGGSYQAFSYYDGQTQILIYVDFEDLIHYQYNQIKKVYNISDVFKNQEQIYLFWHIYKVKLIKKTQIAAFITGMGTYFVQFSQNEDPKIISQLVPYQNEFYHFISFHNQDQKIQIIYSKDDALILYNFDLDQIFNQKYIDYRYLLQPSSSEIFGISGLLFFFNENLYSTNWTPTQIQLLQTTYDHTLIIDKDIKQNTEIQITLSNPEQSKTFIIELIVEKEYLDLKCLICILVIVLVGLFILKRIGWKFDTIRTIFNKTEPTQFLLFIQIN
ncbi:hypothetical protein pb186bvf_006751 [Paramecium bursaria]